MQYFLALRLLKKLSIRSAKNISASAVEKSIVERNATMYQQDSIKSMEPMKRDIYGKNSGRPENLK